MPIDEGESWDEYCWSRNQSPDQWDDPANCNNADAQSDLVACANTLARQEGLEARPVIREQLKGCMRRKGWFLNLHGQVLY